MTGSEKPTDEPTDRKFPLRSLVPNLLTILALGAGLTSIRFGIQGRFEIATGLIILSGILDGLDGRVARYLKGVSKLGAELDSLADFVNFGVAPGILLYLWALQDMRSFGWIAVLTYVICCGLRLARFNVVNREEIKTDAKSAQFFTGVPAPAGALLVMLPLFLFLSDVTSAQEWGAAIAFYLIFIGLLMVSSIPTFSFKTIMVPRSQIKPVLVGLVITVATLITYPWKSLIVLDLVYFGSLIWSLRAYQKTAP
jgi:CDP-diacylglycerol---serine O-phosphatidyltransferase